jgi:hypothetical protein
VVVERASSPKRARGLTVASIALGVTFVACVGIGIVAAIAVPAFIGYIQRAKSSEAGSSLRQLRALVVRHCEERGVYPGTAGPLPAVPGPVLQNVRFDSDPGFAAIGFDPGVAVYYSYAIVPRAAGVDLVARGDLDGDGMLSDFTIESREACACVPGVFVTDELE